MTHPSLFGNWFITSLKEFFPNVFTLGNSKNDIITFTSINYMGKNIICQGETVKTEKIYKMKKLRKFVSKVQRHYPKCIANFSSTFEGVAGVKIDPRIAHWK